MITAISLVAYEAFILACRNGLYTAPMARKSNEVARYLLVQVIGIFFVLIGLFGLVLPILNGIIPLAIGAMLIAMYNPSLHGYIHKLVERLPWLEDVFEQIEKFLERIFGPGPDGTPPIRSGFPNYQRRHAEEAEKATTEGSETSDL